MITRSGGSSIFLGVQATPFIQTAQRSPAQLESTIGKLQWVLIVKARGGMPEWLPLLIRSAAWGMGHQPRRQRRPLADNAGSGTGSPADRCPVRAEAERSDTEAGGTGILRAHQIVVDP